MRLEAQRRFSLYSGAVDAPFGNEICGTLMFRNGEKESGEVATGRRAAEEAPDSLV
jgi:hypothetical protein